MTEKKSLFKAFIRVVKSLSTQDSSNWMGFEPVQVVYEPIIHATDKHQVKEYLLSKYPQFFPTGKVYEKESKDTAQFFYAVIFPLYQHEIDLINEGEWKCEYCGQVYENKYLYRPLKSVKFEGKIFCGPNYKTGNDIVEAPDCYEKWKKEIVFKNADLPDDLNYINANSPNYIYKITEKATGKCYIGKTRNAPFFRWWNHLKHSNSPFGKHLQQTRLTEWTFEVLEELPGNIDNSEVLKVESSYIVKFNSIQNGYNTTISNKNALSIQTDLFEE